MLYKYMAFKNLFLGKGYIGYNRDDFIYSGN